MAEGVRSSKGKVVSGAPGQRPPEPAADPLNAPKGWRFNGKEWVARKYAAKGSKTQPASTPPADDGIQPDDAVLHDPEPAHMRDDKQSDSSTSSGKRKVSFADVPDIAKDNCAGLAGFFGLMLLFPIKAIDPVCGGAVADNYEQIIDAALPLILRSERMVKYFSGDDDWLLWIGLATALKPVGEVMFQHHIVPLFRPKARHGAIAHDHLQPPMPEYNYAA